MKIALLSYVSAMLGVLVGFAIALFIIGNTKPKKKKHFENNITDTFSEKKENTNESESTENSKSDVVEGCDFDDDDYTPEYDTDFDEQMTDEDYYYIDEDEDAFEPYQESNRTPQILTYTDIQELFGDDEDFVAKKRKKEEESYSILKRKMAEAQKDTEEPDDTEEKSGD